MSFVKKIRESLALDDRSLALYRMLMGLIVMVDVLYRLPDLENFYTDIGLIPRNLFLNEMTLPWSMSFHLANGSVGFQAILFSIHFIFGLLLFFGFKTRWAIIGSFLMTVSVHNRNWLINNGGDDILRAILFISIFLPLNRCFSVDSALRGEKATLPQTQFSTWTLTFTLQVFCIYFISFLLKDSPIWTKDYTALYYSSRLDIFAHSFGIWLRDFPGIQKIITFLTIYLEFLGPILLVIPFVFGRFWWQVRLLITIMFIILHVGIIATMKIGVFPYLCIGMWMIFIPSPFWDLLNSKLRKFDSSKITIFYDGECTFCFKMALIFREFLLLPGAKVEAGNLNHESKRKIKENHSWLIISPAGESTHFDGFLTLLKASPSPQIIFKFFSFSPIKKLGDSVYNLIAHNRNSLGHLTQFLAIKSDYKIPRIFSIFYQASGVVFFAALLAWNLGTVKKLGIKDSPLNSIIRWTHTYQEWNMFAPFPKMNNIWVVIPALLENGSEIELMTGSSNPYAMDPQDFYQNIPNEHWRKFYLNLSEKSDYARYFGGYLCRTWNIRKERHLNVDLQKFEIIVYSQMNLPDGGKGEIKKSLSWKHWCNEEMYRKESVDSATK